MSNKINDAIASLEQSLTFAQDFRADDVRTVLDALQGEAVPVAWVHEGDVDRVISAAQKATAIRDGGASATSVKPYTLAAYTRPQPAALSEVSGDSGELGGQQGVVAPERCEECGRRTFHNHPDGYICLHCKLIVSGDQSNTQFALDALVAAGHVEQSKVDQALAISAALAATGKQQVGEVQGGALAAMDSVVAHIESLGPSQIHPDYLHAARVARAALAARQPVAKVPVSTAAQSGKRVSILESACGPVRKFDPVAADAELANIPLVPLWELPELHPRKVASECLTTMEQVRRATRPNTINRVKLTDAIALVGRFVAQMERSERLGTAPPAQGIDLGKVRQLIGDLRTLGVKESSKNDNAGFVDLRCYWALLGVAGDVERSMTGKRDAAPGVRS